MNKRDYCLLSMGTVLVFLLLLAASISMEGQDGIYDLESRIDDIERELD